MDAEERLRDFHLEGGRYYRYLRIPETYVKSKLNYSRDDPIGNVIKFKDFETSLLALDISQDSLEAIYKILAAILILGDVRFKASFIFCNCFRYLFFQFFKESDRDRKAALVEPNVVPKVAELLKVDEKKFQWSLINYCIVVNGKVEKRRHTADQARDARDVLAGTIYARLVDFIVNSINQKFALNRAML